MTIQVIILVFVFFAISRVFLRFYHKEITLPAFLFWILIWIAVTVVTLLPNWASYLASALGVGRGSDLLVYLSIILLLYLVFRLYVRFENLERELTKLVRQLTLRGKPMSKKSSVGKEK